MAERTLNELQGLISPWEPQPNCIECGEPLELGHHDGECSQTDNITEQMLRLCAQGYSAAIAELEETVKMRPMQLYVSVDELTAKLNSMKAQAEGEQK